MRAWLEEDATPIRRAGCAARHLLACSLGLAASALPAAEAGAGAEDPVRNLGAQILARHGIAAPLLSTAFQPRAAAVPLPELARRRADLLAELARDDPARAAASAFGADELAELRARSPDLAPDLEERGTWRGTALPAVADAFGSGDAWRYHVFRTPVGEFDAYGIPHAAKVATGDSVEVSGVLIRGRLAVLEARRVGGPDTELYPGARTCDPTGEQRLAVFLVHQPGTPVPRFSRPQMLDLLFGPRRSLDRYIRTASFGRAWLSGDVFGPFESVGGTEGVEDLARMAGIADLSEYRRVAKIGPDVFGEARIAGVSSVGCWPEGYSVMAITSENPCEGGTCDQLPRLEDLVHELGHGLGLEHARSLVAQGEPLLENAAGMFAEEYGDLYDPMGDGPEGGFYSARNLSGIGWLDAEHVVTAESGGTFFLHNLDGRPEPAAPMALRIPRWPEADEWLWLESRSSAPRLGGFGFDVRPRSYPSFSALPIGGALVRIEGANVLTVNSGGGDFPPDIANTNLLDMSPRRDGFTLAPGRTWNDPHSPLALTIDSVASTGITVRVDRAADCSVVGPVTRAFTPSQQPSGFAVRATANCDWRLRSEADWIQFEGEQPTGVGQADVGYRLARHTGNDDRRARVWIGDEAIDVVQQGRPVRPVVESLHPRRGSGTSGAVRIAVSDANAPAEGLREELRKLLLTFDSSSGTVCSATYDFAQERFSMNHDPSQPAAAVCTLDPAKSRAWFAAGRAFVEFHVALPATASGSLLVGTFVSDRKGLGASGEGSWSVDASAGGPPAIPADEFFVGSGSAGRPSSLQVSAADPDGAYDIASVQFIVRSKEGPEWCAISVATASSTMFLAGYNQPALRSLERFGGPPLENEYCTVVPSSAYTAAGAARSGSPDQRLTTRIGLVYFSQAFAAPKDARVLVRDRSGNSVGGEAAGGFPPVAAPGSPLVLPGTVSPTGGTGVVQRFEWTFLDPAGDAARAGGTLSFTAADSSARCDLVVRADEVTMLGEVRSTATRTWSEPAEIGGEGVLENDLCSVDAASMTDSVAGDRRTIAAVVRFMPALGDVLAISLASDATRGANLLRGAWTVRDGGRGPRIAAVVNAASLTVPIYTYWFAPLEAVTIAGANLGPPAPVRAQPANGLLLADELAGTGLWSWREWNGSTIGRQEALPVLLAGPDRVESVVPLNDSLQHLLRVQRDGESSAPAEFQRGGRLNPALFTADGSGVGQALATNADGSVNGPQSPAPAGSVITLQATGTGRTIWSDAVEGGTTPVDTVSVIIGNRAAEVVAAASEAPGQNPGTTSIRARISASAPTGPRIPVSMAIDGLLSQAGVTVAIGPAMPSQ